MNMKMGVGLAVLGLCGAVGEARADGLTRSEQTRILRAIDSECADTWCEGDYDFRFDSIRCEFDRRVCKLVFRAGLRPMEGGRFRFTIKTHCVLNGISSASDILKTVGCYESLKESAYDQINECIDYRLGEADRARGSGGS